MRVLITANAAWNLVNFRSGLIRALQDAGHEVSAAAPADAEHARVLERMGCRFHPVPVDSKGLSPRRDFATALAYRRLLARTRLDCMLAYTAKPNIYGSLAARSLRVPVINNVSGLGAAFIAGGWLSWTLKRLYQAALSGSHLVFFQNGSDRDEFVTAGVVSGERTKLLPGSGVDLEHFQPSPAPARDGVRFLLIGRVVRDKGLMEYHGAAKLLRRSDPKLRFDILGIQDPLHPTAIPPEQLAAWEEAGDVRYLGEVPDPRPVIADADCVVLPSYREGTSKALLEAAAMAKPLVATDVPGCREVVDEGVNGFLARVRDPEDLARAMARMATLTPVERARMGAASRAKMEREFDERIVIRAYLDAVAGLQRRGH